MSLLPILCMPSCTGLHHLSFQRKKLLYATYAQKTVFRCTFSHWRGSSIYIEPCGILMPKNILWYNYDGQWTSCLILSTWISGLSDNELIRDLFQPFCTFFQQSLKCLETFYMWLMTILLYYCWFICWF